MSQDKAEVIRRAIRARQENGSDKNVISRKKRSGGRKGKDDDDGDQYKYVALALLVVIVGSSVFQLVRIAFQI